MKKINLISVIVFALSMITYAEMIDTESPSWKKARIDSILSDLESRDYARIYNSLGTISNISEQIPPKDLEKMKSLMYDLLEVDIPVPDSHKPPILNVKNFSINIETATVLAQIVNYDKSYGMYMPDNFSKFKKWYEETHLIHQKQEPKMDSASEPTDPNMKNTDQISRQEKPNPPTSPAEKASEYGVKKTEKSESPSSLLMVFLGAAVAISLGIIYLIFRREK